MASPTVLKVEGAAQLRAGLKRTGHDLEDAKEVHGQIAGVIVRAVNPPVSSGATASSVRAGATARASILRAGGGRVPYVVVDHYGWPAHNIAPNLWAIGAAQSSEPTWYPLYERYVQRSLDKIRGAA